jgi:hypothetical protein
MKDENLIKSDLTCEFITPQKIATELEITGSKQKPIYLRIQVNEYKTCYQELPARRLLGRVS